MNKKPITSQELIKFYRTHTDEETCAFLGMGSRSTLYTYLKKWNIPRKGRGYKAKKNTKFQLAV